MIKKIKIGTTVIAENRQDKKVIDEKKYSNAAVEAQSELEYRTVINKKEGITNGPVGIKMSEPSVEIVNIEKGMRVDGLSITGDYSDYDIVNS